MTTLGLRSDLYRRPLALALERLGFSPGWRCVDVGAGGGDVSVELARLSGPTGRVYAVDRDPTSRDVTAEAAAKVRGAQVVTLTQRAEELALPEKVELAYCRFLLLHVDEPARVIEQMVSALAPGGYLVAQEPITTAGRVGGEALSMPDALHQDIGALLPAMVRSSGLELVDAWAEAPAGAGPGAVADYLQAMTEVDPREDPIVLPPLVTVIGRAP